MFWISKVDVERDPKEGCCVRGLDRVVNIGKNSAAKFEADKPTKRCTGLYKLTDCMEMQLTCSHLLVDNRDPEQCKRGNEFNIKAENTKSETYIL